MKRLLVGLGLILGLASVSAEAAPIYGYVQVTTSTAISPPLQNGTMKVSSGTINNLTGSTIKEGTATLAAETVTVSTITTLTAPHIDGVTSLNGVTPGDITSVTAGYGLTGGGTVGGLILNLDGATSSYIQNTTSAQTATFDVSSGTVNGQFSISGEFKPGLISSTSGQVLVSQGAGLSPKFQWGGQILQITTGTVISASTATTVTANYVASGIKASITPKQSGSIIVVIAQLAAIRNSTTADSVNVTIFRGGTNLAASSTNVMASENVAGTTTAIVPATIVKVDTPATTSTTTYEVYFQASGGGSASLSGSGLDCQVTLIEIGQ